MEKHPNLCKFLSEPKPITCPILSRTSLEHETALMQSLLYAMGRMGICRVMATLKQNTNPQPLCLPFGTNKDCTQGTNSPVVSKFAALIQLWNMMWCILHSRGGQSHAPPQEGILVTLGCISVASIALFRVGLLY